jgi:hypothetical protein
MRLEAVTRREQAQALHDIAEAIGAGGGWIVNHQLYSNAMAMIAFAIPGDALAVLADRLAAAEIPLVGRPESWPAGSREQQVQLVVTFLHGGPDLARPVPAFG